MLRLPNLAATLLACLTLFVCGAVAAHTHLKTSLPAAGATLAETPTEIRLHFHKRCLEIDRETAAATFRDDRTGEVERI